MEKSNIIFLLNRKKGWLLLRYKNNNFVPYIHKQPCRKIWFIKQSGDFGAELN